MRPRVRGHRWLNGAWGWFVDWEMRAIDGSYARSEFFWTWEAALDFAVERALYSSHKNHIHLWT